jgi:hypothetical protein
VLGPEVVTAHQKYAFHETTSFLGIVKPRKERDVQGRFIQKEM